MAYLGYVLFALYAICMIAGSGILWLLMGLSIAMYVTEDHTVDADWRPVAVVLFVVGAILQWYLLSAANAILPVMWHSLPPISG